MTLHRIWAFIQLTRPLFLLGGVVLHALGIALAASQGAVIDAGRVAIGQVLVTSIQVMAHYGNEYYDFEVDRLIGRRRTWFSGGSGILPSGQLNRYVAQRAMWVCAVIAVLALIVAGLQTPLIWVIGGMSFLGSYFYSAPPLSLMSSGWGELTTAILTGLLVPLTGFVLQTGRFDPIVLRVCAPGVLIYLAMILTFEFPDHEADAQVGKRTLAVRLGLRRVAQLHNALIIGGLILTALIVGLNQPWPAARLIWLATPLAIWQIAGVVWRTRSGWRQLNLLTTGAVALAAWLPLLWLIGYMTQ